MDFFFDFFLKKRLLKVAMVPLRRGGGARAPRRGAGGADGSPALNTQQNAADRAGNPGRAGSRTATAARPLAAEEPDPAEFDGDGRARAGVVLDSPRPVLHPPAWQPAGGAAAADTADNLATFAADFRTAAEGRGGARR